MLQVTQQQHPVNTKQQALVLQVSQTKCANYAMKMNVTLLSSRVGTSQPVSSVQVAATSAQSVVFLTMILWKYTDSDQADRQKNWTNNNMQPIENQ